MAGMITVRGVEIYVPGAYATTLVSSSLAGPQRAFQVPILLAGAHMGYPYDVADKLVTGESDPLAAQRCATGNAVATLYGADSDMARAFAQAKRHDLPFAYCVCLSALTRASVIVTSTGPVTQFTLYPRLFGTAPGYHKIKWASGVLTTQPWKHFSHLTANASSSATRIYVRDNSWAYAGLAVEVGDNNSANVAAAVVDKGQEIDSSGQVTYWIELDTALGGVYTTAEYAAVVAYGTATEVSDTFTTCQALIDYLNTSSQYWRAVKATGTFTDAVPIAVSSLTPLKDISAWGTVTDGTSPAVVDSDVQDTFTWFEETGNAAIQTASGGLIPRLFLLANSSATAHGYARDYAVNRREPGENRFPVAIVTGCAWGDTAVGADDSTDPVYRAGVLDHQDIQLVANGRDRLAACLSTAAQIWGLRAAGGVSHNLTGDELKGEPETVWTEADRESLIRGGVTTDKLWVALGRSYYGVAQGNNTLQDNLVSWNESTADTPLAQQRDIVDYIQQTQARTATTYLVGREGVSSTKARLVYQTMAKQFEVDGLIEPDSYTLTSVARNATDTGWDVRDAFSPIGTTDFIHTITTIRIGE